MHFPHTHHTLTHILLSCVESMRVLVDDIARKEREKRHILHKYLLTSTRVHGEDTGRDGRVGGMWGGERERERERGDRCLTNERWDVRRERESGEIGA